ncbi:hypothetical protein Fcan01_27311 [Folsomia candida]|uniref:Uncharacterized protein n=1 Tax=Folsomia candida TaxID=158441 RepID=A0A226CYN8_FOLCA|nr:hypothetical protein Fcan01_27311 [Folsomia candida]
MNPTLYLAFSFISPALPTTTNTVPAMTRIGQWFESSTIDLVTLHDSVNSAEFNNFTQHFPNSPYLLSFLPLNLPSCPKPYPLFRLSKHWLTVLLVDSSQNQLIAVSHKLLCLPYQYASPEYFLFYMKTGYCIQPSSDLCR